MQKIAIVEDEESILEVIKFNLELEQYHVQTYNNGLKALEILSEINTYDLIILDVMLPELNGIEICKKIRQIAQVPILFLSAKGNTTDKILGLKAGGNDYLAKPFDLEELLLRVQILTQHKAKVGTHSDSTFIGDKKINFETFEVLDKQSYLVATLSKKEVELLKYFIQEEGKVISRDAILDHVWGKDQFPTSRTIDNFILNFRKWFEINPKEPIYFHSVRGVGYKFVRT